MSWYLNVMFWLFAVPSAAIWFVWIVVSCEEVVRDNERNRKAAKQLDRIRVHWARYMRHLEMRYPPDPGEEFELHCEHHRAIDRVLREGAE